MLDLDHIPSYHVFLFLFLYLFHSFAFNCASTESIAGKANHAVGRIALMMSLAAGSTVQER